MPCRPGFGAALSRALGALAAVGLLAGGGCHAGAAVSPAAPVGGSAPAAAEPGPALRPGRHCFEASAETFTGAVLLSVTTEGRVKGESVGIVHDDDAGYFTSYHQSLTGSLSGDRLALEVVTWIEEDRQLGGQTWTLEGGRLDDGRVAFDAASCEAIVPRVVAAESVLERLATAAGELTIGEREEGTGPVYTVRLAGEPVRRIDAGDEDDALAALPRPTVLRHFHPGVPPFDEVVLVQQVMTGNACNGGPLWFLGSSADGSHAVSSAIDFCGGKDPVVTREGERIRVEIPGGPPNRGAGYIPGETWLYEGGEVRRVAVEAAPATRAGSAPGASRQPWAYCRAAGTVDVPQAGALASETSGALVEPVRQAFDLSPEMPDEQISAWTAWRCMDGEVWACVVGANLPCSETAETDRTPTAAIEEHCRDRPDGELVPAVVTGRATVYTWRCRAGGAEIAGQWSEPDARGFHREIWRRIDPPAK